MSKEVEDHASEELTDEEIAGLVEDEPLDDDEQTHSDDVEDDDKGTSKKSDSESDEVRKFKYGEEELTRDALLEKLDDDYLDNALYALERKANWEKSLTEKGQGFSNEKKLLQPMFDLKKQLTDNQELRETLDDAYKDLTGSETGISELLINEDLDKVTNPFKEELDQLAQEQKEREIKAAEKEILKEEAGLRDMGLTDRQIVTVEQEMEDRFEKDGVWLSMEETARLNHPDWLRPKATPPPNNRGSRSTSHSTSSKKPKSYDDVKEKEFAGVFKE